ncbi:MAG TPA: hypothetical protein QF630_07510 [Alphaproteobacteria bacterium]|nr:hypothetical protein [Alphaproteobacteria bacterium]MDP7641972.1 hypothetical protein [Alphaproteobacteria bacterium]HJN60874.1 hypothetical protein [Alphaproteobacteria bacterium]
MEGETSNKGTIIKLIGVVIIILGILDGMLSWRAGVALSNLYIYLILGGVLLFCVGVLRRGSVAEATESRED